MNDTRFFRFLQQRIGLDVDSVGAAMVERALQQRCVAVQAQDLDDYWLHLQQSASEQQALIEAVIVPETWFFRYAESFAALLSLARKRLAEPGRERPLRLLSLPCSTGEEPYSIAMALLDGGLSPDSFSIDALDISPLSIAKAEQALYGRNSFRGSEQAFKARHFDEREGGQQLHERVRRQVTLQVGNVLDPALLAREGRYDFVFCRNLLIYFDLPTQQRVFEVLKRLMAANGVLFIGPAEGSLLARLGMRPVGIAQSFAYVREQTPTAAQSSPPRTVPGQAQSLQKARPAQPARSGATRSGATRSETARPSAARSDSARAQVAATPRLARPSAPTASTPTQNEAALLAHIAAQANAGDSRQARVSCEQYLRQFAPKAQVYYWLGLLSDTEGDTSQALAHYRKALYLEPQHADTLVHLAALLAAQGDHSGARRLQERAARAGRRTDA
ncbi:CheR family methyltransferase [Pseudomonas sp.]|uniref:CheR family methyltransferase n=1 Tax=Pseudomonas sp. TaxID=306 RepID=UPI0028B0D6D1|nr:CheR family methyltransferase [Pseudomonas sp.]